MSIIRMPQLRKQRTPKRRGEPTEPITRQALDPKSHAAFSGRLRIALKNAGASVLSVAEAAGVSDSTIHLWLKGSEPSREKLIALAGAIRVSVEWLATGRGEMRADGPAGYIVPSWPGDRPPLLFELGWFRANFGRVIAAPEHVRDGLEPEGNLPLHLLEVPDDSMEPTLRKGDLLLAREGGADYRTNGLHLVERTRAKPGEQVLELDLKTRRPAKAHENITGKFVLDVKGKLVQRILPRRVEWSANSIAIVTCDNQAYPGIIKIGEKKEPGFRIYARVIWHGRIV
jgi:transcriptional regulator with XRE-family HTH domain